MNVWNVLSALLFLALGTTIALNYDDYGISWDEIFHYRYGEEKLDYYQELISSDEPWAVIQDVPEDNYPGFYDMTLSLVNRLSPLGITRTNHILCAVFGTLGIAAVWLIGYQFGGPRTAFVCALFLTFMPRYYGHMWFNLKDIPFAAMFTCSLYCLIRMTESLPKLSWRWLIAAGVITGCTIGIRSAGLLLPCYLFVVFTGDWLRSAFQGASAKTLAQTALARTGTLFIYGFIALIALLPWWPYLHANPLWRPIEITLELQNFFWNGLILFNGEYLRPGSLPRSYLPTWIGITTPLVILLLLAIGFGALLVTCKQQIQGRLKTLTNRDIAIGLMILAFAFPILYVVATKPRIYDALRQFLFILPPAAVLAAIALKWVVEHIARPLLKKLIFWGALTITSAGSLLSYISLHPYEYIYFNEAIGGLPGAFMRFETEYYGLSYRALTEKLIEEGHQVPWNRPTRIANNGAQWHTQPFMTKDYEYVPPTEYADYFLTYTRINIVAPPGLFVEVIEREGVPLNYAIQVWNPNFPDPLEDPVKNANEEMTSQAQQ